MTDPKNPFKRHVHRWVWKRRVNPVDGSRPYDLYECECGEIDERPV